MQKNKLFKIALGCILLLGCGLIAAFVYDVNPLARVKPENRSLDQLLADMKVEVFTTPTSRVQMRLQGLSGADVDISEFRGKIVFLSFWATWCPTCVNEMPSVEKLHRQINDKDFTVVAVSIQETAATVKRFVDKHNLTFRTLLDLSGKTVPGFGIRAIPTTLIIDKTGRIIGRTMGPREWDSQESVAMFKKLVAEL